MFTIKGVSFLKKTALYVFLEIARHLISDKNVISSDLQAEHI
jgi:hypothetical protein